MVPYRRRLPGATRRRRRRTTLVTALLAAGLALGVTSPAAPAAPRGGGASGARTQAHGLKGDYYLQSAPGAFDFAEYKATRVDPDLDVDSLESRLLATTGRADDVSVRWTGQLEPDRSGAYTFSVTGDNGFRVWIGGREVVDHWVDDWDEEQTSEPVTLEAGTRYDVKVEYFEHEGGSNLHLDWTPPGGTQEPVPADALYLPPDFAYDGPDSTRVQASGRTLRMDFPDPLAAPPAGAAGALSAVIGGADWPLRGVSRDPDDPSALLVSLREPVVGQGGDVEVHYTGEGGLARADGTPLGEFWASGENRSTYQLRTRWADDVGPGNAHPEYPRPQLTRDAWRNLNGTWQFAAARAGEQPPVGRRLGEHVLVPYPVESALSGVQRHEERMWYRRTFTVPRDWRIAAGGRRDGQRLELNFEGVDWQAEVYVNGHRVAAHKGGYDRFTADVTGALTPGGGPQELIVGVYDPTDAPGGENPPMGKQRLDPSGIFYTPSSGIWQTVWMEPVPVHHAASVRTTPQVDRERLDVVVADAAAPADGGAGVPVTVAAYDGKRRVGTATGRTGAHLSVPVPHPHLWSPDDPHLYDLRVTVGAGRDADRVGGYFGMRSIGVREVAGKQRIVLNGAPVFSMATLDQGFWPDGLHTAPTDEALRYDLQTLKKLGYNAVRKHIKVEPARWYYWADRLGLMVWQDMPAMNTVAPSPAARTEYEHELKRMIDQHYDSPAVVMWVTFNEGWGQYGGGRVPDLAREWDPTRLVDGASGWNDTGNGDVADVHAYPGPGDPRPEAHRAGVTGEYGGLGVAVPGHSWPVQQSYVDVDDFTAEYLDLLADVHRLLACNGSSGAVYTQVTDVEGELNGLLTYDRAVLKADVGRIRAAHERLIADSRDPGSLTCPSARGGGR